MSGWLRWLAVLVLSCAAVPPAGPDAPGRTGSAASDAVTDSSRRPLPPLDLVDRVPLWLPTFYRALRDLSQGSRATHVRVLWLGDSHTAADFWTEAVRDPLQERFGAGGAGLVMVGLKRYRHGLALLERTGRWRRVPRSPAGTRPREDGVLGLGGVGAVPRDGRATARLRLRRGVAFAEQPLRWEILYRLRSPGAAFEVSTEHGARRRVRATDGVLRSSGIKSFVLETRDSREIALQRFSGSLELFGVIVERDEPGVVFDTLGINGARAATPLSWDRDAWVEEVRARAPSLVILAYGTNEVGDVVPAVRYQRHYVELVERLRMASPEADCLILGPTDRTRPDWTTYPRVREIERAQKQVAGELGCAFFSPLEAMGGPGGLKRWAFENPPRARRDHVHLTPRGYDELGRQLADRLLESYDVIHEERP